MDKGDVAGWVAAAIAVIAAFIAMSNANSAKTQASAALKQASEAERSRKAAEESAAEARKANEFMREKDAREQAEQYEAAVAEASKVRAQLEFVNNGVLFVRNHGGQPVFDLEIESVISKNGMWSWEVDNRLPYAPSYFDTIPVNDARQLVMVRADTSAETNGMYTADYHITFSFTDSAERRWRRTNNDRPQQIR